MALDTIPKQEGGKLKAVASGTLPNGKPVVVNSDGTVSVVAGSDSSAGSPVVFNSATSTMLHRSSVYDSANNKIVIAFKDYNNSQYGTAIVGTISGSTITFGSSTVFQSASITHQVITFDSSNNKVVIAYRDGGAGKAIVGTVSGTSISFGSPTTFESSGIEGVGITFDTANNKVVISYSDLDSSAHGTAVVGTVSSTSISFGTPVVFEAARTDYTSAAFDGNNGKVVISYSDKSNSNYGTVVVGTVSGTSISFGSAVVYTSEYTVYNAIVFDSNVNKVVISYRAAADGDKGKSVVGTVSGTSISFGSAATFASGGVSIVSTTYDTSLNKVLVAYNDKGNSNYGTIAIGTVSGTSISFAPGGVFESASVDDINITYDANANKSAVFYFDGGNSNYGTASVFTAGSTNLTSENYIGMSTSGTVADGDNATIDIVGAVNKEQSGLTAGQQYYVQTDGTIGTTPADPSVLAGTAVSATKMVVKS